MAPSTLIDVPDKDLLKAFRRGDREERRGLLDLLARLPKRARGVLEELLGRQDLDAATADEAGRLLSELTPSHPWSAAVRALDEALDGGPRERLEPAFAALPERLRASWLRRAASRVVGADPAVGLAILEASDRLGRELGEAIGRLGSPEAARWLEAAAPRATAGPLRKALKAAAYRLSQAGRDVDVSPLTAPAAPIAAPAEAPAITAWASSYDAMGDRAVWLAGPFSGPGQAVVQALISDSLGIRELSVFEMRRRDLHALLEDLRKERSLIAVEVPWRHALGLLEESFFTNPEASDRSYSSFRTAEQIAARASLEPLALEPAARLEEEDVRELLAHRVASSWGLAAEPLEAAERALEGGASALVLPPQEEAARQRAARAEAARLVFEPVAVARWRRRLEETARLLGGLGEQRLAGVAQRLARDLDEQDPSASPLLSRLLELGLERLRERRESDGDSGRIVSP